MKSLFLVGMLTSSVLARPATKTKRFSIKSEDDTTVGSSDINILTYALILEHLEDAFYRGGLENFTASQFANAGYDGSVYTNLQQASSDESNHVAFLTSALTAAGAQVPQECTYNFPYTDPTSFMTLATILEGVGVSAYLGAAVDIASSDYLAAAGSIMTVEARHASYLRSQISEAPYPSAYDTPLDFTQVHSLAYPFFAVCPSTNPSLPVTALPALSVQSTGNLSAPYAPGSTITLATPRTVLVPSQSLPVQTSTSTPTPTITLTPHQAPEPTLYAAFLTPTGPVFAPVTPTTDPVTGSTVYNVQIPPNLAGGQTYVLLTSCGDAVSDDTTLAGPAVVEIAVQ